MKTVRLSVIMPFYKRHADLVRVFPLNHTFLNRPDIEVILSLDEDSEERLVMDFIRRYTDVRWKILVCHEEHEWRTPAKALNAGIKAACGEFLLIVSPESAFVEDVPMQMLCMVESHPNSAICGRVHFLTYAEMEQAGSTVKAMGRFLAGEATTPLSKGDPHHIFYGSICVARSSAMAVAGYDECFIQWGGEDDNFRRRLALSGVAIVRTPHVNVAHLSETPRLTKVRQFTPAEERKIYRPNRILCPECASRWEKNDATFAFNWMEAERLS